MARKKEEVTVPREVAAAESVTRALGLQGEVTKIPLSEIRVDPELQARVEVDQATVDAYAELMEDGVVFPPVEIIEDDGVYWLTDGFHRVAAATKADLLEIDAEIRLGTRRDAEIRALGANTKNAKNRTNEDKLKAVRRLLRDPELCHLTSDAAGKYLGVSHTYINQRRRAYGVKRGEVLTEARACLVDGVPTGAWQSLLNRAKPYERDLLDQIRKADGPRELAALMGKVHQDVGREAIALRQVELRTQVWPWGEEDDVPARVASLDTARDLEAALSAATLPESDVDALYAILRLVPTIPDARFIAPSLQEMLVLVEGRPALVAAVEASHARAVRERAEVARRSPFERARAIMEATDPDTQAALLVAAAADADLSLPDLLAHLHVERLHPEVFAGAYQQVVAPEGVVPCVNPTCRGWTPARAPVEGHQWLCVVCRTSPERIRKEQRNVLQTAAALLQQPGFGLRIDNVIVDQPTVELLRCLSQELRDGTAVGWLSRLPASVRGAIRTWSERPPARFEQDTTSPVQPSPKESP